jgi:GTPase SAR1 family protein
LQNTGKKQAKNMTETRNILIIGRTGNGKSTLANVLTNSEKFNEGSGTTSTTKELQKENFEIEINGEKIQYRVIDTIGIGDTQLGQRQVLNRIAEACYEVDRGLNQIFFVLGRKFTEEELEAYNILREIIFDENITYYTTIVRTNFPDFDSKEKCEEDREKLNQESPKLAELVRTCNKLIYVDNPPTNIEIGKDISEKQKKRKQNEIETNREKREESRDVLISHLISNCSNYRPPGLDNLNKRVSSYMTEKEQLKKELDDLKNATEEEKRKTEEKIAQLEAKIEEKTKEVLTWEEHAKKWKKKYCVIS